MDPIEPVRRRIPDIPAVERPPAPRPIRRDRRQDGDVEEDLLHYPDRRRPGRRDDESAQGSGDEAGAIWDGDEQYVPPETHPSGDLPDDRPHIDVTA